MQDKGNKPTSPLRLDHISLPHNPLEDLYSENGDSLLTQEILPLYMITIIWRAKMFTRKGKSSQDLSLLLFVESSEIRQSY